MEEFDNNQSTEDLFNEVDSTDQDVLIPDSEPKEQPQEEDRSTDRTVVQEEKQEQDHFKELEQGEEEVEDNENNPQNDRYSTLAHLRDLGYINYEDTELDSLEEDDLDAFMESKMDHMVRESVIASLEGLPPMLKELNMYALEGGDIASFFAQIANNNATGIYEGIDLSNKDNQEHVVRAALAAQGYDQNYINSNIEFLVNSNNLETHATNYYNQFIQSQKMQMQEMVKAQREQELLREQTLRNSLKQMNSYVNSLDAVGDIPLSFRDKNDVANYMFYPSIKLEDGTTISDLQKDLYYEVMNNPNAVLQLALLLRNRKEDGTFDFSFIQKKAETKVANKARQGIRRQQNTVPSNASGSIPNYKNKSLADYFS